MLVCDVKQGGNWGSLCDQDSTAGSCHSLTPHPPHILHKIKSLDCTLGLTILRRQTKKAEKERQDKQSHNFRFSKRTQFKRLYRLFRLCTSWCLLSPLINKVRQQRHQRNRYHTITYLTTLLNNLLFIPNVLFFQVYTFSLGIPCERYQWQMTWIAKFNLDKFVRGNVCLVVQNYCRGLGERSLMIMLLTSKNKYTKVNSQAVLNTH